MASRIFQQALLAGLLLTGSMLYAASDWEKAADLRKQDEIDKAGKLLRKYASPAGFEQLKSAEKIDFLRGLLELAHVRALQDEVAESLALLNWAEGREDPYQRSLACVKYAEILLDLGEFERAQGYLKNADEAIGKRAEEQKEAGAAIGQAGVTADTGAAWRELRDDSDALKAEIEAEAMKKKFGATYGSYVKLRRLQRIARRARTPRYRLEALKVADEIIETDPASQFAAAAGYLKGEILASRLKEDTPKKEIKEVREYLERFIRQQPEGLYRGEALMLLGKILLEIEWDIKTAEKYYKEALDYFRSAREKRDALSLYANLNENLKKQTTPLQKTTSFNQWKRIVYSDEDPLKLYNTSEAPPWYIDNKEKHCLLLLGFFKFNKGDYTSANQLWYAACKLDSDLMNLNALGIANILQRLQIASAQKKMFFSEQERKKLSVTFKPRITYAEFLFGLEEFEKAYKIFWTIQNSSSIPDFDKAAALIGLGYCSDLLLLAKSKKERLKMAEKTLQNAYKLSKGSLLEKAALWQLAEYLSSSTETQADAIPYYELFLKKYPNDPRYNSAKFALGICYFQLQDFDNAIAIYYEQKRIDPNMFQVKQFERIFQQLRFDPVRKSFAKEIK